MQYYLGAYYLIKLLDSSVIDSMRKYLYTPSTCINDSLLDGWSLSWVKNQPRDFKKASEKFSITPDEITQIQAWADQKFNEEKIGWLHVFNDLETLREYKKFFKTPDQDVKTLAIYLSESDKERLLKDYNFEGKTTAAFGLESLLLKQIGETEEGKIIGYDLIGIELSGDFHTFYCHDLANELKEKFAVKINEYGLIEDCEDFEKLVEFMNDEENGHEPVSWFLAKVKMFDV